MEQNQYKKPPFLNPGDTIGIVATARSVSEDEIYPAKRLLESWGLHVVLGDHLFSVSDQFAGSDFQRAFDFQKMLDDSSVKALLCARGGYGTIRMLPHINFSSFVSHPKWIIGYSDVCVLHAHIHSLFCIETIHACMAFDFSEWETPATKTLNQALFGQHIGYHFASNPLNRTGVSSGPLIGGNLSILYSLRGTVSDLDWGGKILFIEDLDEYLYHIDRIMMNFKHGGKLAHLKGMIVGGMTQMHDNVVPFGKTAEQIIIDSVKEYDFPVCFGFPAGHLKTENKALFLGRNISLEITREKVRLEW